MGEETVATIPQSSESLPRDLVVRPEIPAREAGLIYLEPVQPYTPPQEDGGGVPAMWQLIRGRRLMILVMALVGAAGGLAISLIQTPIYDASDTIEFQSTRGNEPAVGAATDGGGFSPESYLQTQVKVLQSTTLRKRVVAKLAKAGFGTYESPDRLAKVRHMFGLPPAPPAVLKTPPVTTTVRILDNSRLIEIQTSSPDPKYAAAFADALAAEFIDYNMEAVWQSAQKQSDWMTRQLQDLRAKLEQSENQLQTYTKDAGLTFLGQGPEENVDDAQLRQLQKALADAQADRIAKQSAYEIASTTQAESLPQVLDNGRLSEYQTKLADLRRQYAEQSSIYTPAHYKVAQLQAQITDLENTLRRERANIVARIQNDFQAALRRERMLQTAYTTQMQRVTDLSRKAIYYGILKREVDTNRQVYEQLLQKAKQVGIGSVSTPTNIRVVDSAEIPRKPSKPDLLRNAATGLASGLVLAFGFVVAGEYINRSVRAPGESPSHLRVPELGVIPSKAAVSEQSLLPSILPAKSATPGSTTKPKLELVTWQDRPSLLAEAYRNALTSILAAHAKGRPKVILITSAGHGEGKSTTVSNLGIALAEINQKVLLIDADLRKPRLHDIFNLPNTWGLSDLLREKSSLADCPLEALARKTEIDHLYVLPSGPGTVSITNLLYSTRMADLVKRVRLDFDITIIDTPPMSYLSDARVLGQLADAAILVIRAARTTRDEARAAKQRLVDDNIRVLGTILNAWEPKSKSRYGYGYGYGYSTPKV
jgi:capsular exopolysaccharide synthesis family protein